jgi:hypothetical protein
VVVVEGATLATLVTGTITMLIIGVLLNIAGLGIFCWALFALAIHALPFFVGMTVGSIHFRPEQVRSVPSSLASLWPVSQSSSGSTLSPSPVLLSFALSLGCYLRFLRHAPATMRPSPLLTLGCPRLVAGGVRRFRRHHRRVHRLGARVDPD